MLYENEQTKVQIFATKHMPNTCIVLFMFYLKSVNFTLG